MDAMKKQRLTAAGIDVDDALARFMGNEALLERMLTKFAGDANYARLQAAVEQQDAQAALQASHTLKGLAGNLSLSALTPLFTRQVELLRAGDAHGAFALLPEIDRAYRQALDAIGA